MTIKAILRDGKIQPLEPLPADWEKGQELVVEQPESEESAEQIDQWVAELDIATSKIPAEEHERFLRAIKEIRQEGKEAVRRKWGLS